MQLTFQLHKFESRSAGVDKRASAIRPSEKAHRSSLRRCTTAKARAPRSPAPPAVNRTATCVTRHVSSALSAVVKTDRLFHCIWDKFVWTIVGVLPHLRMSVNTFPLLTKNLRRNFAAGHHLWCRRRQAHEPGRSISAAKEAKKTRHTQKCLLMVHNQEKCRPHSERY